MPRSWLYVSGGMSVSPEKPQKLQSSILNIIVSHKTNNSDDLVDEEERKRLGVLDLKRRITMLNGDTLDDGIL